MIFIFITVFIFLVFPILFHSLHIINDLKNTQALNYWILANIEQTPMDILIFIYAIFIPHVEMNIWQLHQLAFTSIRD